MAGEWEEGEEEEKKKGKEGEARRKQGREEGTRERGGDFLLSFAFLSVGVQLKEVYRFLSLLNELT
jgi:hypothetical protein